MNWEQLLPIRLQLQQKNKCKISFALFDIIFPDILIEDNIWSKFYSKDGGYWEIRHISTHKGIYELLMNNTPIEIEILEEIILDVSRFLIEIESKIIAREYFKNGNEIELHGQTS